MGQGVFWNTEMSEEGKAEETERILRQFHPGGIVESALEADQEQD